VLEIFKIFAISLAQLRWNKTCNLQGLLIEDPSLNRICPIIFHNSSQEDNKYDTQSSQHNHGNNGLDGGDGVFD
jgi:hypothetical protein